MSSDYSSSEFGCVVIVTGLMFSFYVGRGRVLLVCVVKYYRRVRFMFMNLQSYIGTSLDRSVNDK